MVDFGDYKAFLESYLDRQPRCEALGSFLKQRFAKLARRLGIKAEVSARPKSLTSLADKIVRPGKSYDMRRIDDLTDLCGVRVVVHTREAAARLEGAIRGAVEDYEIFPEHSEDKAERLGHEEFGYLSIHLVLRPLRDVPQDLEDLMAEVQIRTYAQHTWAAVYHNLGYKTPIVLPSRWRRDFARAAAMLEGCDEIFQGIRKDLAGVEVGLESRLPPESLDEQDRRFEIVLELLEKQGGGFEEKGKVLDRLLRVNLSLGAGEDRLIDLLGRADAFGTGLPAGEAVPIPLLRSAGLAWLEVGRKRAGRGDSPGELLARGRGMKLLSEAGTNDPDDAEAPSQLADYLAEIRPADRHGIRDGYHDGFFRQPNHAKTLTGYVLEELPGLDPGIRAPLGHGAAAADTYLAGLAPMLQSADDRCSRQLRLGLDIPGAHFDRGFLHVLLGNPDAMVHYCRGVALANSARELGSAARKLARLLETPVRRDGIDAIGQFLDIAAASRALRSGGASTPSRASAGGSCNPFDGAKADPVLLIAGARLLDPAMDPSGNLDPRLRLILEGIDSFKGTVVFLDGSDHFLSLARQFMTPRTTVVAYVPSTLEDAIDAANQAGIQVRGTPSGSSGLSFEALCFWADLVESGRSPSDVKVLGYDLGEKNLSAHWGRRDRQISRESAYPRDFEYPLALALGASVAVIRIRGTADFVLADPAWENVPNLRPLGAAANQIRGFLAGKMASPAVRLGRRFDDAVAFANRLHLRRCCKGTESPLMVHLLSTASLVLGAGPLLRPTGSAAGAEAVEDRELTAIAAILHHAAQEPDPEAHPDICRRFGLTVGHLVKLLANSSGPEGAVWLTRKEHYLAWLPTAPHAIQLVALCDKLDEARSAVEASRTRGGAIWERYGGGRDGTLWFYRKLKEAFEGLSLPLGLVSEFEAAIAGLETVPDPDKELTSPPAGAGV